MSLNRNKIKKSYRKQTVRQWIIMDNYCGVLAHKNKLNKNYIII